MSVPTTTPTAIALNRFGLGARPDETAPADAKRWLNEQFGRFEVRPAAYAALPDVGQIAADYVRQQQAMRQAAGGAGRRLQQPQVQPPAQTPAMQDGDAAMAPAAAQRQRRQQRLQAMQGTAAAPADGAPDARQALRKDLATDMRDIYRGAVNARADVALTSQAPFVERLVHFWSNHFAVSADKLTVIPFAGAFEAEAIRPHVLGRFEDMLVAVETHPAMLLYLDQAQSIGPDSQGAMLVASRNPQRKLGLNENLAREIMELHTLGVRTGYTQADVTEFARALTGWSIGGLGGGAGLGGGFRRANNDKPGVFVFREAVHEPGVRTILGKRYAQRDGEQAHAVLHDLAASPATAHHIATKLTRHFAGDEPPPAMVERLAAAYTRSGGDLPTVYRALIDSPEAWAPTPLKFKTPWEWTISSMRAMGRTTLTGVDMAPIQTQLGQPVWRPGSPAGFDDVAASWAAPDALVRRVEIAQRFASVAGDRIDARELAGKILPGSASPDTVAAISRSESAPVALALLLVSPDFQRR